MHIFLSGSPGEATVVRGLPKIAFLHIFRFEREIFPN